MEILNNPGFEQLLSSLKRSRRFVKFSPAYATPHSCLQTYSPWQARVVRTFLFYFYATIDRLSAFYVFVKVFYFLAFFAVFGLSCALSVADGLEFDTLAVPLNALNPVLATTPRSSSVRVDWRRIWSTTDARASS